MKQPSIKIQLLRTFAWAISNLLNSKDIPISLATIALDKLEQFLVIDDRKIKEDTLFGLQYLSNNPNLIDIIFESNIVGMNLKAFLNSQDEDLKYLALTVFGNLFLSERSDHLDTLLNLGVLEEVFRIIKSKPNDSTMKSCLWILSNIVLDYKQAVVEIFNHDIMNILI